MGLRLTNCPVNGKCLKTEVIYRAKVIEENGNEQTYTGLTCNSFKERWDKHNFTFTHKDADHTTLSSFIHELQEKGTNYNIKWEIVEKARPFNPVHMCPPSLTINRVKLCVFNSDEGSEEVQQLFFYQRQSG